MWRDLSPLADEISRALTEMVQVEDVIACAITRCRDALDAERVAVLLLDAQTDELYFPHVADVDPVLAARLHQARVPANRGVAGLVLRSGQSARIDDVSADPQFPSEVDWQTGRRVRAILCAPLTAVHGVVGVIEAANLFGAAIFTDDDRTFLETVAAGLAQGITRALPPEPPGPTANGIELNEAGLGRGEPAEVSTEGSASPHAGEAAGVASGNIFRREGEYWTIKFGGTVARLKDAKGLHFIAWLLRHPGREFHVTELVGLVGEAPPGLHEVGGEPFRGQDGGPDSVQALRISGLGDAGPVLDDKAKVEYKRRLDDLRAELDDAERCNDPGRAERAREEIEFLSEQLTAAVGLGGRDRVAASGAERARLAVTKRIKAALGKIRNANPALGQHLAAAITTGYFCSYTPKADSPADWSIE